MSEQLPRGPIYFDDGSTAGDVSDGYESAMQYWRAAAYEEAVQTRKLSPEENRIQVYRNFIEGKHSQGRTPRYRSNFYINKTDKARRDSLALLTDSRPDIEIDSRISQYQPQADVIDKVLRSEWSQNDMDLSLISAVDIAKVTGTSFWKITAGAPGMLNVNPLGPDCVMPIQPGMHIQQSTAVLYRTWKSLAETVKKFPLRAKDLERESSAMPFMGQGQMYGKPDNIPQWTWNGMAPQMQRMIGKRLTAEDMPMQGMFKTVEWQEYWVEDLTVNESSQTIIMRDPYIPMDKHNWWYKVEPGQRLYPRKRLITFAGKRLIYDGPSPFWHGLFPFACLRLNPVFWSFWGLSGYRDLIPVNAAINKIIQGILDMTEKALNPSIIARGQSVNRASWDSFFPDMPGGKLRLEGPNANAQSDIQFSKPPAIPDYVGQVLSQFLGPEFDKLANTIDITALSKKDQVPGGDTIEQMRDSLQTGLRLEGRYIESFLKDAGIQAVSHIFQFYSGRQRLRLVGPDGMTVSDFDADFGTLTPQTENRYDHWKNFRVSVMPGSLHPGAKDRSKLMYMNLAATGKIDDETLLEKLEIPNIPQIQQRKQAQMEQMAQLAQSGAGGAAPGSPIRMTRGQRNGSPV